MTKEYRLFTFPEPYLTEAPNTSAQIISKFATCISSKDLGYLFSDGSRMLIAMKKGVIDSSISYQEHKDKFREFANVRYEADRLTFQSLGVDDYFHAVVDMKSPYPLGKLVEIESMISILNKWVMEYLSFGKIRTLDSAHYHVREVLDDGSMLTIPELSFTSGIDRIFNHYKDSAVKQFVLRRLHDNKSFGMLVLHGDIDEKKAKKLTKVAVKHGLNYLRATYSVTKILQAILRFYYGPSDYPINRIITPYSEVSVMYHDYKEVIPPKTVAKIRKIMEGKNHAGQ